MKAVRANNAIKRNVPNGFLWLYYSFKSEYKTEPVDLQDMLDGLSCIRAQNEIKEIYNEQ